MLAAGKSRRFGMMPKQLARRDGVPLVVHAVRAGQAAAPQVILVAGHQRERVVGAARRVGRVRVARAGGPGQGDSLRAGLRAMRPIERTALILLADMPEAGPLRLRLSAACGAVRPAWRGRPGHPVLVRRSLLEQRTLAGDRGLGHALTARLVAADRRALFDIDRPGQLRLRVPRLRR